MDKRLRVAFGVFLGFLGALWVGQGLGWIGGSFMTNEPLWIVVGALVAVAGVALAARQKPPAG